MFKWFTRTLDEVIPKGTPSAYDKQREEDFYVLRRRLQSINDELHAELGREPTHGEIWERLYA